MKTLITLVIALVLSSSWAQQQTTSIEVEVNGKGSPILLFPGFTCTAEVWEETVENLSQQYECHSFTFAGFGDVAPIESPWLDTIKKDILEYIELKNLKQPDVIGHSLGGSLGLWLAAEHGEQFGEILVVDALPAMGALMIPDYKAEHIAYDTPYNRQLLEMNEEAFAQMASQMAMGMTNNSEKRRQIIDWMTQTDRKTYVYGYTDLLKMDLRESLSKIKNPVTILAATMPYGKEMAQQTYKMQYANLTNYKITFAEDAAHFIMFDQPEWFQEQIRSTFE